MKGVKCFSGLATFYIICLLFLSLFLGLDANALKHEYLGIPLLSPTYPANFLYHDNNDLFEIDWTNSGHGYDDFNSFGGYPAFELWIDDQAYYSDLEDISWANNMSYMTLHYNQETHKCEYHDFSSLANWTNVHDSEYNYFRVTFGPQFLDPRLKLNFSSFPSSNNLVCQFHERFSDNSRIQFNTGSLNNGLISRPTIGTETGFVNSASSSHDAYNAYFDDTWFTYDGFYVRDSEVDSNTGIHYNHSFSFKDMFTKDIKQFSKLTIPLWTYDNYWTNPENFYEDRQVKWTGVFDFDAPVTMNPNMSSDSYMRISGYGYTQDQQGVETHIPCHFNYTEVAAADFYQLEYVCEGRFVNSYIYWLPYLEMYNPDDYIFTTNGSWRWGSFFLTTDNDDTLGESFGGLESGIGEAGPDSGNDVDNNIDWTSSLTFMFDDISVLNPFANIFSLFTNQSACANIPTLAGMLHSNETQVCPWFSSATRAIVTPVLGLSSMMLLFGFVVRWLGARSGNFIEDSEGHDAGGLHFANKFRRNK